ncbi:hypothetical protein JXA80_14550 [bacterium]|nr:hypothetical protein [candidate division CSSED10-310 bacterium]
MRKILGIIGFIVWVGSVPAIPARSADITLTLQMPGTHFTPADTCGLDLLIANTGPSRNAAQVFVALTVGTGDYWFYPNWIHYPPAVDWLSHDVSTGDDTLEILPGFAWPSGAGTFTGAMFLSAVVHEGNLVSNLAEYSFGWSEPTPPTPPPTDLIQPDDLIYLGAFRLPGGDTPPLTFAYGGNAMTFNPDGNPSGSSSGLPGSLFITAHDRQPWGTLPDGDQIAEIAIPEPAVEPLPENLPVAEFLQEFHNPLAGQFTSMEEIPRIGMAYLNHPDTGPLLHIGWGQHMPPETPPATHGWFSPNLAAPAFQGTWYIGSQDFNSVNGYLFPIPVTWATAYTGGRVLATGRFRDGGWSGMGPALFAYRPWHSGGSPPPDGTRLSEIPLLLYQSSATSEEITRCMTGYQHPDEWEGGSWLVTPAGRSAVVFAGTKSTGIKYWYGYIHPDGPEHPCVDVHITDFVTCRMADGSPCPAEDFAGCCDDALGDCISLRGWWSSRFDGCMIFYNPDDLARVAAGTMDSWAPQPYAMLDIDDVLYLNPSGVDRETLGWGDQLRNRIGDMAYDDANGVLYVLELYANGAAPVVHVWDVGD